MINIDRLDLHSVETTPADMKFEFTQIWTFFILSFAISWIFWLAPLLSSQGLFTMSSGIVGILMIVGTFGPTVAAVYLNRTRKSPESNKALFRRGIQVRFSWKWYVVIFLLLPLGGLFGNVMNLVINDVPFPVTDALKMPYMIPFIIIFSLFLGPISEEFGWRGYALDRMQTRWSPFVSSIVLGAIWALWHLPAFFVDGAPQRTIPPLLFTITLIAISVVISWVQNSTNRSLFPAIMLHAMINSTGEIFPLFDNQTGGEAEPWVFANIFLVIVALLVGMFAMRSDEH